MPAAMPLPLTGAKRAFVLAMLMTVGILNFLDRQIVGILAVPIKAELGLSDLQLGLMGGLAFALFYTTLGLPIALLSDRFNRSWIITICLAFWSAMTAACGLAQNFWHLFLARVGVGIGEAGGGPATYSIISDYFPPEQRARALGVYSFSIPIGSALGVVMGGVIASYIDWRAAFFIAGLVGISLAPFFKWVVREPLRGQYDPDTARTAPAPVGEVFRILIGKRSFWLLSLGAASGTMVAYGLFFWLPSFFVRSHGLDLLDASLAFGALLVLGGVPGIWAGGYFADRLGTGRRAAYATIPAIAFLCTVPLFAIGVLAPSFPVMFVVMVIPIALGLAWVGPIISAIQQIVSPNMRATASAVFLLITNLFGLGLGTVLLGSLSDGLQARFGADSLRYSILAGSAFYVIGAALFFWGSRTLEEEWEK
ncbi:MAG: MFS transporter [Sphingomonadales bacterium]